METKKLKYGISTKQKQTYNREQTYGGQGRGSVEEERTEGLELPDANHYRQDG